MAHSQKKNLPKNFLIIIILFLISIITVCWFIFKPKNKTFPENLSMLINNQPYYLEVAQTPQSQEKGLSGRNQLCSNCGMLFVFTREGKYPFWMKDTHIPLDIIWLNSKYQIVKITTAVKTDSNNLYTNQKPAKYVIELNANESFRLNLNIGDTVKIPNPND